MPNSAEYTALQPAEPQYGFAKVGCWGLFYFWLFKLWRFVRTYLQDPSNVVITGGTITAQTITVTGTMTTNDLVVTDDATIQDDLAVQGDALVGGTFAASGATLFSSTVGISGALSVNGDATLGNNTGGDEVYINSKLFSLNLQPTSAADGGTTTIIKPVTLLQTSGGATIATHTISFSGYSPITGTVIIIASYGSITTLDFGASIVRNFSATDFAAKGYVQLVNYAGDWYVCG